ncbi:MAG: hypothetical protein A2750_03145 [Candidatus Yanofskybacteria bacterium RIFCSPHIGHO2_01_FULL_45_42]|uniref:Uncharacterized protein n=3 Tax=Candidatus Yanofskyibacteriota TaxID=1752733 RepID=A0A1F8H2A8_9BACT|nr:MAG: hypothetical protein A2750_03145 [Candidatus Yanofskybacteria bacterium RIFCSPHIGHO2_01_FULL_45_42]OGN16451.1 MAG: hypothetical protein A3C81_00595 [Candidatus Yanofskybacteria bacterium RIFCSPHIGHO2_02_FULL_46_19]OGN27360.1 MAG: hypothetical protein A3B17_00135 [Candidatus Yanofskybacteria bacterium RIFCSPLOWO2_01_FULL_45_72]OGN31681.1 MAG: hypothetical protein A3J01_02160 [Candidatus Yanofskybacteria bacterium RIFCSPLOWO2_02_FULL_45_18]
MESKINKLAESIGFEPLEEKPKDPEKVVFDKATYKKASVLYQPEVCRVLLDRHQGLITLEEAEKRMVPISRKIVDTYIQMMDAKEKQEDLF